MQGERPSRSGPPSSTQAAGEAEVCDVDVLAGVEQDVGRLHVTVHEAARVCRVERPARPARKSGRRVPGRAAPALRSSTARSLPST